MTAADPFAELRSILESICEGRMTAAQSERLDELTLRSPAARRFYLEYIELHGNLHWDAAQGDSARDEAVRGDRTSEEPPSRETSSGELAIPRDEALAIERLTGYSIYRRSHSRRWTRSDLRLITVFGAAALLLLSIATWTAWRFRAPSIESAPIVSVNEPRLLTESGRVRPVDRGATKPAITRGRSSLPDSSATPRSSATDRRDAQPRRKTAMASFDSRRKVSVRTTALERPLQNMSSPLAGAPPRVVGTAAVLSRSPATGTQTFSEQEESTPLPVVPFIDSMIQNGWKAAGVEPSPIATDGEWLRRVYLDVVGHTPPEEAVNAFLVDPARDKRAAVVDRLLKDSAYPRNWATIWANALVGRPAPAPGVSREALEKYLRDSFAANIAWNEIVYELISAEGSADQNPATNFLLAHLNNDAVPATALTARLFLGIQLQCTQCHDHPFYKDQQNRFWELNSFFQQTEMVSRGPIDSAKQMAPLDEPARRPELVTRPIGGATFYETLRGEMRAAFPVYAGRRIDPGPAVNRRRELARLMTRGDDRQLALAMVNRMWQHFFGHGFTHPVDDMGAHNPPSHPEVLNRLAREFVATDYDLKQLIRWICATDAYQRTSSFGRKNWADDPTNGGAPLFSRVYLKPLTAEQLYDSLMVATRAKSSARTDWNEFGRRRQDWLRQFVINYGTDENDETSTLSGTISQALVMMNDPIVQGALTIEPGTLLYDVAHEVGDDDAKIRRLCRAALSRDPTEPELEAAREQLQTARDGATSKKDRIRADSRALQDLFWAYLNANEFALVH
jgi:hypothetical protein